MTVDAFSLINQIGIISINVISNQATDHLNESAIEQINDMIEWQLYHVAIAKFKQLMIIVSFWRVRGGRWIKSTNADTGQPVAGNVASVQARVSHASEAALWRHKRGWKDPAHLFSDETQRYCLAPSALRPPRCHLPAAPGRRAAITRRRRQLPPVNRQIRSNCPSLATAARPISS